MRERKEGKGRGGKEKRRKSRREGAAALLRPKPGTTHGQSFTLSQSQQITRTAQLMG